MRNAVMGFGREKTTQTNTVYYWHVISNHCHSQKAVLNLVSWSQYWKQLANSTAFIRCWIGVEISNLVYSYIVLNSTVASRHTCIYSICHTDCWSNMKVAGQSWRFFVKTLRSWSVCVVFVNGDKIADNITINGKIRPVLEEITIPPKTTRNTI